MSNDSKHRNWTPPSVDGQHGLLLPAIGIPGSAIFGMIERITLPGISNGRRALEP